MPNISENKTWCPGCRDMCIYQAKPYILAGEKRRDDHFCSICNHRVIPNSTGDQHYRRHERWEWIERSGIKHFGVEILSEIIGIMVILMAALALWSLF